MAVTVQIQTYRAVKDRETTSVESEPAELLGAVTQMSTTNSIQEHVRKEKTSIHNRLKSIQEDSIFVKSVSKTYAHLKVVANQRCGSWYVDPEDESTGKEWVYFKSTDGHHGRWEFSLRRANLHLLPSIDAIGG